MSKQSQIKGSAFKDTISTMNQWGLDQSAVSIEKKTLLVQSHDIIIFVCLSALSLLILGKKDLSITNNALILKMTS